MRIKVKVQPKSSRCCLEKLPDGSYKAYLKSAPTDGKANAELIALVAREFGAKKYQVEIKAGLTGRQKTIELDIG